MKLSRKVFVASAMMIAGSFVFAQTQQVQKKSDSEKETSVESEYLNDVDGDIIMTLAESDEYDNKLVALQYLQSALEDGNTSDAVIQALDKLAGEGLTTQSRTNGRLTNNYPEIRREACKLMAKVPTEHSKNTLISIAVADNEPMVIAAAVIFFTFLRKLFKKSVSLLTNRCYIMIVSRNTSYSINHSLFIFS